MNKQRLPTLVIYRFFCYALNTTEWRALWSSILLILALTCDCAQWTFSSFCSLMHSRTTRSPFQHPISCRCRLCQMCTLYMSERFYLKLNINISGKFRYFTLSRLHKYMKLRAYLPSWVVATKPRSPFSLDLSEWKLSVSKLLRVGKSPTRSQCSITDIAAGTFKGESQPW